MNTALHTSGKNLEDKADCIVGVYSDWVYNSNLIVRVYSHWVITAKCIVGVYRDWVYNDSSGCTGIVGIYSDWMYNANWKPVVLWVHNASYIAGGSGNREPAVPETATTATLVLVCETLWSSIDNLCSIVHCSPCQTHCSYAAAYFI